MIVNPRENIWSITVVGKGDGTVIVQPVNAPIEVNKAVVNALNALRLPLPQLAP